MAGENDFGSIAMEVYGPLRDLRSRQKWKDKLTEISINGPGDVWLRIAGQGYVQLPSKEAAFATQNWGRKLCSSFAAALDINWAQDLPVLACRTPDGDRFQAMIGRNVESGMTISIRVKRLMNASFENFGVKDKAIQDRLIQAVSSGENIMLSGGTGTGKTTFLNLLAQYVPEWKRVITAEDTRELVIKNPNRIHFIVSRTESATRIDYPIVIDTVLRSNPDEFTLGELSIINAFYFAQILDTGHEGCRATMHSNSPWDALRGIRRRVAMSGGSGASETSDMIEFLAKNIGLIIQIKHFPPSGTNTERREVTHIKSPKELLDSRTSRADFKEEESRFDRHYDMGKARDLLMAASGGELTCDDQAFLARFSLLVHGGAFASHAPQSNKIHHAETFSAEERTIMDARSLGLMGTGKKEVSLKIESHGKV